MKITANLEFDTFAEAEKIFRHLGMLDTPLDVRRTLKNEPEEHAAKPAEHPTPAAASGAAETTTAAPSSASGESAGPTLQDVKDAFTAYVQKAGGRTAATAKTIMTHHGIPSGRFSDVKPEQYVVLKRALDTAGPEMPLGEAA